MPAIQSIPLDSAKQNKDCYFRKDMGNMNHLAAQIERNGVRDSILVKKDKGGKTYTVIDGWRRILAAKKAVKKGAKIAKIPVKFVDGASDKANEIFLSLNAASSPGGLPLRPMEEARAIKVLQDTYGLSAREIGKNTPITTPTIIDRRKLLDGSPRLQKAVDYENYPVTIAKLLINSYGDDFAMQDKLVDETSASEKLDPVLAREARKDLVKRLSGTMAMYEGPVKEMTKLLRKAKLKPGSLDEALSLAEKQKGPDAIKLASAVGIVKGLSLALGSKFPDPFIKKAAKA